MEIVMEKLTLDDLRKGLEWLERNYASLMAHGEYSMADMLSVKIDAYQDAIVARICSEDPYTTESDVRYFEGFRV
jgi:predicted secreted hydrolase